MMNAWLKGKATAHNKFSKASTTIEQWATESNDQQSSIQRGYLTTLRRTSEFSKGTLATNVSNSEMEQLRRITERARTGK
ncbi:MAG: hypothetical protein K2W95_07255 [Candidatus Obscuribacterales bacterium]|nr:hypothetical protein [Candidatus Obscuribacterales bacterium]